MFSSNTTQVSDGGYQISRSLRFNSADSAYLERTPATATNRRTWTWSGWVKRSVIGSGSQSIFTGYWASTDAGYFNIVFRSGDDLAIQTYNIDVRITTQVFRDPSAWYHIVVAVDTTQASNTDRFKLYVNGAQITTFSSTGTVAQNTELAVNYNGAHYIGSLTTSGALLNGYQTECYLIDGQALTPSSFGETNAQTGVWQPKAYSGSYGTNGFYLNFSDNSNTTAATLGKDYSGNGNNWTPNNFSVTAGAGNDSLVDSPTSYGTDTGVGGTVRGNYATLNPIIPATVTVTNGNLDISSTADNNLYATLDTGTTGKWYAEFTITSATNSSWPFMGTRKANSLLGGNTSTFYPGVGTGGEVAYLASGNKYIAGNVSAYGTSYTQNDVIGIAIDCDNGATYFSKNGVFQNSGVPTSGASKTGAANTWTGASQSFFIGAAVGSASSTLTSGTFNFGQRPFAYTAPSGFKALCTQNLPTPTIGATTATQAGKFFNPVLYTGNGSTQSVTGVGFQPDWTWLKVRSTSGNHFLTDAVRGAGLTLYSNLTNAEDNNSSLFTGFTSDGFNLAGGNATVNANGSTFVSWNWKANGSGSTNTAGSITSTVSANTTSGFSVLTYTGTGAVATIGHGLGVAPSMIIVKSRSTPSSSYAARWSTYHVSLGNTKVIRLESTEAAATASYWNNTTPTSTVFSVDGDIYGANVSGVTYVAYVFAEVAGYSKFGSYTGNGSSDGPFVYCGFRPAFVLFKRTDATSDWWMYDTKRSPSNVIDIILWPNYSDAEGTFSSIAIDILSNGFKPRSDNGTFNGSGGTYIFMAFAESPQKFSLAR